MSIGEWLFALSPVVKALLIVLGAVGLFWLLLTMAEISAVMEAENREDE